MSGIENIALLIVSLIFFRTVDYKLLKALKTKYWIHTCRNASNKHPPGISAPSVKRPPYSE